MKRTLKLGTYPDTSGKVRWRVVAGNGKVLAKSPGGYPEGDARLASDIGFITGSEHDAELYRDRRGEWRWRLRRDGKRIVAVSSEGYVNRGDCERASDLFLDATPA